MGWVRALRGDVDGGARQAEAALMTLIKAVTSAAASTCRSASAIVGRAEAAGGDIDGALALFDAALTTACTEHGRMRWYEAELLRFRAEMLLAQPKTTLRPRRSGA